MNYFEFFNFFLKKILLNLALDTIPHIISCPIKTAIQTHFTDNPKFTKFFYKRPYHLSPCQCQ